jgi:hypothetical protein
VASSADGSRLVAVTSGNGIYTSSDAGTNWAPATNAPNSASAKWIAVASSADGSRLIAAESNSLYTSADFGVTWTSTNLPVRQWTSVACSGDGQVMAAGVPSGDSICFTTNGGVTWMSTNTPSNDQSYVACSADGRHLVVAFQVGYIYVSTNNGVAWSTNGAPGTGWSAVAASRDGSVLTGATGSIYGGDVFTLRPGSGGWTADNAPHLDWISLAGSADGSVQAAVASSGLAVFVSTNSGATWATNTVTNAGGSFSAVAMSADGGQIVVTRAKNGGIWKSQTAPPPQLKVGPGGGNLNFSWIVPAAPFSLQESTDLTSWSDSTNALALNATNLELGVSIPTPGGSRYYRLKSR